MTLHTQKTQIPSKVQQYHHLLKLEIIDECRFSLKESEKLPTSNISTYTIIRVNQRLSPVIELVPSAYSPLVVTDKL